MRGRRRELSDCSSGKSSGRGFHQLFLAWKGAANSAEPPTECLAACGPARIWVEGATPVGLTDAHTCAHIPVIM